MSKLTEYLKLLPKGIPNLDKVVEGVVRNAMFEHLPEDQKDIIIQRRIACATCPFMSKNATTSEEFLSLTGFRYTTKREDDHCTFCGCPIKTRTASLESPCGIANWNKDNPDKQMPLTWEKVEQ